MMRKCIMVKVRGEKQNTPKVTKIGEFICFAEICNMHHWLLGDGRIGRLCSRYDYSINPASI